MDYFPILTPPRLVPFPFLWHNLGWRSLLSLLGWSLDLWIYRQTRRCWSRRFSFPCHIFHHHAYSLRNTPLAREIARYREGPIYSTTTSHNRTISYHHGKVQTRPRNSLDVQPPYFCICNGTHSVREISPYGHSPCVHLRDVRPSSLIMARP